MQNLEQLWFFPIRSLSVAFCHGLFVDSKIYVGVPAILASYGISKLLLGWNCQKNTLKHAINFVIRTPIVMIWLGAQDERRSLLCGVTASFWPTPKVLQMSFVSGAIVNFPSQNLHLFYMHLTRLIWHAYQELHNIGCKLFQCLWIHAFYHINYRCSCTTNAKPSERLVFRIFTWY